MARIQLSTLLFNGFLSKCCLQKQVILCLFQSQSITLMSRHFFQTREPAGPVNLLSKSNRSCNKCRNKRSLHSSCSAIMPAEHAELDQTSNIADMRGKMYYSCSVLRRESIFVDHVNIACTPCMLCVQASSWTENIIIWGSGHGECFLRSNWPRLPDWQLHYFTQ